MIYFLNQIAESYLNHMTRYSFIFESDYLYNLANYYFSKGFVAGLIFVLLIRKSIPEKRNIINFCKVLVIIAIINSGSGLSHYIDGLLTQGFSYTTTENIYYAPNNIISGFLLTLVIISCYRKLDLKAFIFGVTVQAVVPLMNIEFFLGINDRIFLLQIAGRIIYCGVICVIMCRSKNYYTSWILYFIFHIATRIVDYYLPLLANIYFKGSVYYVDTSFDSFIKLIFSFRTDTIVFAIILMFALIYEKNILKYRTVTTC